MLQLLWLIPAIPFASTLVLALFGRRMSQRMVAIAGVGSIGLSALISVAIVPALSRLWNALTPRCCGPGSMWRDSALKLRSISTRCHC